MNDRTQISYIQWKFVNEMVLSSCLFADCFYFVPSSRKGCWEYHDAINYSTAELFSWTDNLFLPIDRFRLRIDSRRQKLLKLNSNQDAKKLKLTDLAALQIKTLIYWFKGFSTCRATFCRFGALSTSKKIPPLATLCRRRFGDKTKLVCFVRGVRGACLPVRV